MAEPSKLDLSYEPDLTGLLIVDPYNEFLSEGGKLYELSRATLEAHNVVEHMREVLAAARARGMQVFIAPHHRWREGDLHRHWKTTPPIGASSMKGRVFADGTWGGSFAKCAAFFGLHESHYSGDATKRLICRGYPRN